MENKTILVTGGAGYIGSHTVLALTEAGYGVVVLDNLSTGIAEAVLEPARLVVADLHDTGAVRRTIEDNAVSGIIHFAASIVVPESVENPLKYYDNNTVTTIGLLEAARDLGVEQFIFSSTAAVYGMPEESPLNEDAPTSPINPYGWSKLFNEQCIKDTGFAHPGLKYAILRYFNVAGADPEGRLGQNSPQATHLIKVACQAALGRREGMDMYGTDYDTPDGTCIRDYIHVSDLADVHVKALEYLEQGSESGVFNCGYGHGFSVREIVDMVKRVSGVDFPVRESSRRPGDAGELVADSSRLAKAMGWRPRLDDTEAIIKSALEWERQS